jgi:hypothetical protein
MSWIKNALIDIGVTVLIVLTAVLDLTWTRWVVLIYTPLMLIMKIVAFLGSASLGTLQRKSDGVPTWFYHVLYAVNVGVMAGYAYLSAGVPARHGWMLAAGWALIWILSIAAEVRMRPAAAR